jgi:hypothetical protein
MSSNPVYGGVPTTANIPAAGANNIEMSRNPVYGGVPMIVADNITFQNPLRGGGPVTSSGRIDPTAGADNIETSPNPVYGRGIAGSAESDSDYLFMM